ncbi:hypothetical protein WA026_001645 [Henosepilachna vigintioctopunctata]|uniref:STING ligand-binding domain-containing protein n=1 Tax=Henosepilachna vigintioctopunctata TaxID=420089 RepID=A0AAW1UQI5_9CUCU
MENSEDIAHKNRPEWYIVSDKKNGTTYFPKTIPQVRESTSTWITATTSLFLLIGAAAFCGNNIYFLFQVYSCGGLLLFLVELIFRIILLYEEYKYHYTSRYGNNSKKLLKHIFYFSPLCILLFLGFVGILFLSYTFQGYIGLNKLNDSPLVLGLTLCSILFLKKLSHLEQAPIYNSLKIEKNDGLNYGSGMAYSFFHGYLKLILPKSGREDKNLIEEIENYADSQGVTFPVAKLFILIPNSCVCHVSLKDDKFPSIEESSSLGEKIQTVAAVQNRVYKNSVYKILDNKRKERVYVCVEYATPLSTFRKGLESSGPHTAKCYNMELLISIQKLQ